MQNNIENYHLKTQGSGNLKDKNKISSKNWTSIQMNVIQYNKKWACRNNKSLLITQ
jgi:hypothetical protein